MSPVVILMGLFAVAYFGSMLIGGRAIRGFGLPSGTEFLLLGIFLGPEFLGVITREGLESFEPLVIFALTWLGLTIGLSYGYVGERRVPGRRLLAGLGLAALSLIAVGGSVALAASLVTSLRGIDLAILGLGAGAVSAETTRHAVRWVTERFETSGALSTLVADVCEADDVVPLTALAILFALVPQEDAVVLPLPVGVLVLATLAAGGVMGATCAALADIEPRMSQRWGIVLGTTLMAAGTSMRLGLSAMSATFVMGVTAASLAKSRRALRKMIATTERAVMLPAFVLAGAYVTVPTVSGLVLIVAVGVAARTASKLVSGQLVVRSAGAASAGGSLGLGLMPAGILTMAVGLACALRFPGTLGHTILALATVHAVLGEIVGPAMLRRALRIAGEIQLAGATPMPDAPRHRSRGSNVTEPTRPTSRAAPHARASRPREGEP